MKSNKNIDPKNDSLKDNLNVTTESSNSSSDVVSVDEAAAGAVQKAYDLSIDSVEDSPLAEAKETEKLIKAKNEIEARIDEVCGLVKAATKLEEEEIPDIKARYEYS